MRTMTRMTLAAAIAVALPALAAAQTGGSSKADSSGRHDMGMRRGGQGMRGSGGSMGLSSDQVMQLQQSLTSAGCDAGTADGKMGPRTHRAMQCAEQKNNVTSGNVNDLFRAMNLSFTVSDSMAAMHQRMHGNRGNMGRGRMRDSTGTSNRGMGTMGNMGNSGTSGDSSRTKPPIR